MIAKSAFRVGKNAWMFAVLILLLAAIPTASFAQVDTGTISGVVRDQSGAVVPGATITLTNAATDLILKTTSNSVGLYQFSALRIGTYTISAEAKGFAKVTQQNATLAIQQNLVADFTMQPGSVTQVIQVTSAPAQLQTEDASVGSVVEQQSINDLPLNGRNYTFLAQLDAGVNQNQQDSRGLGSSGSFVANGTAYNQNNYLLDGIDNNSNLTDFLNGNSYVYRPSVDALSEFKVQTSNFSAEFGRSGGAVLNATIKSGTDHFHGALWEFFRNDGLDAKNYFEPQKGRFQQNQFGADIGGPLLGHGNKRTFFFLDFEGLRVNQATPYVSTVPTALEQSSGFTNLSDLLSQGGTQTDLLGRAFPAGTVFDPATTRTVTQGQTDPITGDQATGSGYVRDPFPLVNGQANILPQTRVDSNAVKMLAAFPAPTNSNLFGNYSSDPLATDHLYQGDFRMDQTFGDKDQAFARYSYAHDEKFIPGPISTIIDGGGFDTGGISNISENLAVSETHIFSNTLVNEARFGFGAVNTLLSQANAGDLTAPSQFGIQGIPQVPNNGGLPTYTLSGLVEIGGSPWEPSHEGDNNYQLTDNITKTMGRQTLKGGFEFQHVNLHFYQPAFGRGDFDYNGSYTEVPTYTSGNTGIAQLILTPIPSTLPAGDGGLDYVGGSDAVEGSNQAAPSIARKYYAGYGQDDWRVSTKLTLNLGVRYEYFGHGVAPGGAALNFLWPTSSHGAEMLFPKSTCAEANAGTLLSPTVMAALASDNIAITCTGNDALVKSDKGDFAPRVGFAYQLLPKLVVRSAFGLFYGTTVNGDTLVDAINYPFSYTETYNIPDPGHPVTFPNGSTATFENGLSAVSFTPLNVPAAGLGFTGTDYKFRTPYTQEYNFTLQYLLSPNQSVSAGYVGTQGRHSQVHLGVNEPTEILVPGTSVQNYVQYPNFARGFTQNTASTNTHYNAMQLNYQHRMSNGLDMMANYTWSQCRTDARDILIGDIGGYRAPTLPGFGVKGDYGLCDYDVKNMFHLSGEYELPIGRGKLFLKDSSAVTDVLLGGWKTNFILTMQTGQPFTVGCTIATTADYGCNADVNKGVSLYGEHNIHHWVNSAAFANPSVAASNGQTDYSILGGAPTQAYGPDWKRFDFSVFKMFPLTESRRFEFRSEFFNLPNHPNFGNPGFSAPGIAAAPGALDFQSNNFGEILGTRDGASDQREIQFALKFYY